MSLRSRTLTTTIATIGVALTVSASVGAPAQAAPEPDGARTLSTGALLPSQIAVRAGTVYYSDSFAGTVTKLTRKGPKVVASVKGEISGVALSGRKLAFTNTVGEKGQRLTIRRPGRRPVVAALGNYERTVNPDRNVTYGILAGGNDCARQALAGLTRLPATYKGVKDSHPYQVEALPGGAWAVAEAGGNAILRVNKRGRISTIALLPRQPITFTAQQVKALGAPDCITGVTYAWEPVPTDVERDARGNLWVSTLPGGPEDPSLGARGSVYKINKRGDVRRIATGFLGATNLAVRGGKVYVAELFHDRISTIRNGRVVTVRSIARPSAVEATRRNLFVGQMAAMDEQGNPTTPGAVYRFPR